jgi:hypothetical protein
MRKSTRIEPLIVVLRHTFAHALEHSPSVRAAARALDMPYSSFRDKAERYGLLRKRADTRAPKHEPNRHSRARRHSNRRR